MSYGANACPAECAHPGQKSRTRNEASSPSIFFHDALELGRHFLRKLSRVTTSPGVPPAAFALGASVGAVGAFCMGACEPSASACLNCRPNCTEGSAKVLMAGK